MPKKRKTRKDKLHLDQKRQTVHEVTEPVASSPKSETQQKQESPTTGMTFSLPATHEHSPVPSQKTKHSSAETITVSTDGYAYLSNDLMRTALLTGAIVFAELVIKLFIVR